MEPTDICKQREGEVYPLFCAGCGQKKKAMELFQGDLCKDCLSASMKRGTATINNVVSFRKKWEMVAKDDYPRTVA